MTPGEALISGFHRAAARCCAPSRGLFGLVASDPTVSRLIDALAAAPEKALKAIRAARTTARDRAWALAGEAAPGAGGEPITIGLDSTLLIAHSDKDRVAPTWKCTFGFNLTEKICEAILALPERVWQPAYDAEGHVRDGAWVAELTGLLDY